MILACMTILIIDMMNPLNNVLSKFVYEIDPFRIRCIQRQMMCVCFQKKKAQK